MRNTEIAFGLIQAARAPGRGAARCAYLDQGSDAPHMVTSTPHRYDVQSAGESAGVASC
jgi:hypothetical protein